MSIVKKILGNTFAQIFGKIGTALFALVTINVLSSYFTASEFGDYGTIYEFLAFFGAIADMGIYTLALREMSKFEHKKSHIYANAFTLRFFLTTFAMILAGVGAFLIPQYTQTLIPKGVMIAAIATFFVLMSGTVSIVLQLVWKMKFFSYALIGGKFITLLGVLFITQYVFPKASDQSFFWILWMGLFGSFSTFVFTFLYSQKELPLKPSFDFISLKKIFLEALPFGISMILATLYFRLGFLLLGVLLPRSENGECGYEFCGDIESGKYYVAIRMMEVLLLFPLFFMNSVLPLLAKQIEEKTKNVSRILSSSILFLFAMGFPIAIGGVVLARPIAAALSDEKLLSTINTFGADTAFQILSFPLFFSFLTTFFNFALISFNQQRKVLQINFYALIFNFFWNIFLIPKFGLLGAALSAAFSELLILFLGIYFLKKEASFFPKTSEGLKIFGASLFMGVFALFCFSFLEKMTTQGLALLITIPISAGLFLFVLFITGFFTSEIISFLRKKTHEREAISSLDDL